MQQQALSNVHCSQYLAANQSVTPPEQWDPSAQSK
jgi:hypothetical protein